MEQGKTRRVNIRSKLFGALFVISLIFIMISVTFSWFTTGKQASVSGIQMQVAEGEKLKLLINGEWVEDEYNLNFGETILEARSGNGLYFYERKPGAANNGDIENYRQVIDATTSTAPLSETYMTNGVFAFDFEMLSDNDATLHLYPKSMGENPVSTMVYPAASKAYQDPEFSDKYPNGNQSPKGDGENCDVGYICGAMRIAFLQGEKQSDGTIIYTPKLIWAPATSVQLDKDENGQYIVKTENVDYETSYDYITFDSTTSSDVRIPVSTTADNVAAGKSATQEGLTYAWGELSEKLPVGDLTGGEHAYFRMVVWIDGEDRECNNALLNGLVKVVLNFGL